MADEIPQTIAAPNPEVLCLSSVHFSHRGIAVGVPGPGAVPGGVARFVQSHLALTHSLESLVAYFARAGRCFHLASNHSAICYYA